MKKYYWELDFYGRKRIAFMTQDEAMIWAKCNGGKATKIQNQHY